MSWKDRLPEQARSKLRRASHPQWITPMLATLTYKVFSDSDWIYERKLDGQRVLAFRSGSDVRLMSRNRKPNTGRYPEIVEALEDLDLDDFILDGEVVAFDGNVTSFEKLQPRMQIEDADKARQSGVRVFYYIFDVMHLEGHSVTQLRLRDRKAILRHAFSFPDPLRFTPHRNREGEAFFARACREGWEGVIAKDASSVYQHRRSRDWLKFKCSNQQEFVIGGYTDPKGERVGFGALLIGFYDEGELKYAGKVGTGYDEETLEMLGKRLSSLERKTSPFDSDSVPANGVHWVTPKLVAEVAFTEWTRDNKLRHPRFLGLRDDKKPEAVVKEIPVDASP